MIRSILIIALGGLPAGWLMYWAHFLVLGALSDFSEQPFAALMLIAWFLLGTAGTLALWAAAFGKTTPALVGGLLAGLVAVSPLVYLVARLSLAGEESLFDVANLLFLGPAGVAVTLIVSYFAGAAIREKGRR